LAKRGTAFTNAHCQATLCNPSRSSVLTGLRPSTTGIHGLSPGIRQVERTKDVVTLPQTFTRAGWETFTCGKIYHDGSIPQKDRDSEFKTWGPAPGQSLPDKRFAKLPGNPIRMMDWGAFPEKDEDIADTFTREAVGFIERNKEKPFFLYFAPHDVHPPTIPHPRFVGTTGLGNRADMLSELDWSVGEILKTLERHGLAKNTLVIFSSDNGASPMNENGHLPNGPWRGKKSQLWEGGHREPFIARWPGHIASGTTSDDLVCLVDLPATAAAVAGQKLAEGAAPDSFNLLPILLGQPEAKKRDSLVVMSGKGDLAIRQGSWKYIPDLALANGWDSGPVKPNAPARPGLFDLSKDKGESQNLYKDRPEIAKRMAGLLTNAQSAKSTRPPSSK
ncbi:MAG: hypothetical protein CFE26_13075, partial [Verrucomicrobiales bacterium VVV1]